MVAAHEKYLYIAFLWTISVFFFKICVATKRSRIKLTMTIIWYSENTLKM